MALHRQMRNSTNTLIIGLTCSDLMFLTLCIPFTGKCPECNSCRAVNFPPFPSPNATLLLPPKTAIDYASPVWVLPTWMCPLINYLQVSLPFCHPYPSRHPLPFQHSSAYFSVWTLTLMAADRFLAVVFPVESLTLRWPSRTTSESQI